MDAGDGVPDDQVLACKIVEEHAAVASIADEPVVVDGGGRAEGRGGDETGVDLVTGLAADEPEQGRRAVKLAVAAAEGGV